MMLRAETAHPSGLWHSEANPLIHTKGKTVAPDKLGDLLGPWYHKLCCCCCGVAVVAAAVGVVIAFAFAAAAVVVVVSCHVVSSRLISVRFAVCVCFRKCCAGTYSNSYSPSPGRVGYSAMPTRQARESPWQLVRKLSFNSRSLCSVVELPRFKASFQLMPMRKNKNTSGSSGKRNAWCRFKALPAVCSNTTGNDGFFGTVSSTDFASMSRTETALECQAFSAQTYLFLVMTGRSRRLTSETAILVGRIQTVSDFEG